MMDFFRRHMRTIFLITIVGFIGGGVFVGFGSYFFGGKTSADAVAEVNGRKISYRRYATLLNRSLDAMRRDKQEVNETVIQQRKQEVLQELIQEEVFTELAKDYGIRVTDAELASSIHNSQVFQRDGRFDRMTYFRFLAEVLRETPKEFEESQRRQIAMFKVRQLIYSGIRISEPELQFEYAQANRGSMADYAKEREKFLQQLRQERSMMVFNDLLRDINKDLKVQVHLQEIERGA